MMLLRFLALMTTCLACTPSARAAPVQLIDIPDYYATGESFTFEVALPGVTDLASYQIDVLLSSDTGIAGTDFMFGAVNPAPTTDGYLFPSDEFFATAINTDSPTLQRLTLSDLNFNGGNIDGVDIVPGVNDRVAEINILTAADLSSPLQISVDDQTLILDGPQATPTPVAEFNSIAADTMSQAPVTVVAVPEPGGVSLMLVATTFAMFRTRKPRSRATTRS